MAKDRWARGVLAPGHHPDLRPSEPGAAGAALDRDLARLKTGVPGGWPFIVWVRMVPAP